MIREKRNKEKLKQYYNKFVNEGTIDPNVHPWVAESWKQSVAVNPSGGKTLTLDNLSAEQLKEKQETHKTAIGFLDNFYKLSREYFNMHGLSMMLVDMDNCVLKSYSLPFFQRVLENLDGAHVGVEHVGTTSITIAKERQLPFLIFGPEIWLENAHSGDACSAPIFVDGEMRYIVNIFSLDQPDLPYNLLMCLLTSLKYSMEIYLVQTEQLQVAERILSEIPQAVYHVKGNGAVSYANKAGQERLGDSKNLSEVFLNYEHLPIIKGFEGHACHNHETRWLTPHHTYEDITSVIPVKSENGADNALIITAAIEDLKTTVAHATGYSNRYSLYSMVGTSEEFLSLQNKATKLARYNNHVLLQGEPGTGKQRLAYGIHNSSPRAAAPVITVHCDNSEETLEMELFGNGEDLLGKLYIAKDGTLFIDEIEKMPVAVGNKLEKILGEQGELMNLRIIAACDSNLKKLTNKGLFSAKLYNMLSKTTLRVPALRKRVSDIEVIASHILAEMSNQYALPVKTLSAEAVQLLERTDWPGNIKQLQGVLEAAFFHTTGTVVLPAHIQVPHKRGSEKQWKHDKEVFLALWKAAGGNICKLALNLDVSRVTLYRYLKKYDFQHR